MRKLFRTLLTVVAAVSFSAATAVVAAAQTTGTVLEGTELARIVPSAFYFQGLSAPTQMRNSAAARFGSNRFVIAGLVDTAGYAADVREKYQGFLISDSRVRIGNFELGVGAYGFGFVGDKFSVLDLSGKELFSGPTQTDKEMKRPRPLQITAVAGGIRLYAGRNYVTIAAP